MESLAILFWVVVLFIPIGFAVSLVWMVVDFNRKFGKSRKLASELLEHLNNAKQAIDEEETSTEEQDNGEEG